MGSAAKRLKPEYKAYESEAAGGPAGATNMTIAATARVVNNQPQPEGAAMPMKLPSVASPMVGAHLTHPASRAAVLSDNNKAIFG